MENKERAVASRLIKKYSIILILIGAHDCSDND